ncbi:unnamed protein product [Polarella glacialis]|uniref:Uncharacterized protein n=1 Tax=Polarella glacialis TaxID=89957 RepID=A0A813HPQ3_POLGL|nr:unnamed protein product [Polarella glacialis]
MSSSSFSGVKRTGLSFKGEADKSKKKRRDKHHDSVPGEPVVKKEGQEEKDAEDDVPIVKGSGRIVSNTTTVHGFETKFKDEVEVGDTVMLHHPISLEVEMRLVMSVLSQRSMVLHQGFSKDCASTCEYHVRKDSLKIQEKAKAEVAEGADPSELQDAASKELQRHVGVQVRHQEGGEGGIGRGHAGRALQGGSGQVVLHLRRSVPAFQFAFLHPCLHVSVSFVSTTVLKTRWVFINSHFATKTATVFIDNNKQDTTTCNHCCYHRICFFSFFPTAVVSELLRQFLPSSVVALPCCYLCAAFDELPVLELQSDHCPHSKVGQHLIICEICTGTESVHDIPRTNGAKHVLFFWLEYRLFALCQCSLRFFMQPCDPAQP